MFMVVPLARNVYVALGGCCRHNCNCGGGGTTLNPWLGFGGDRIILTTIGERRSGKV